MSNAGYPDEPTYANMQPPGSQGNQAPAYQYPPSNPYPYPPPGHPPPPGAPYYQPGDEVERASDYGSARAESRYSSQTDGQGNIIERRQQFFYDKNQQRANIRSGATTGIYFLLGVLEVMLGLRWLFRLLGANTANNFISFLYSLSHIFVAPFNNIFNDQTLGHGGVFEFSTLIAMLVYALIAWGLVSLISLLFQPVSGSTDSTFSTRRHRRY